MIRARPKSSHSWAQLGCNGPDSFKSCRRSAMRSCIDSGILSMRLSTFFGTRTLYIGQCKPNEVTCRRLASPDEKASAEITYAPRR